MVALDPETSEGQWFVCSLEYKIFNIYWYSSDVQELLQLLSRDFLRGLSISNRVKLWS